MISLTRLNGTKFFVNAELVEQLESAPDTVITLITGNNMIVKETVQQVRERIIEYRGEVAAAARQKSPA
jgi:flagellar protein FlbD